jgi:hypothetical protein
LVLANANGPGGHPIWTKLAINALKPGPRCSQTAVYDTVNNRMMVCGGENADAVYYVRDAFRRLWPRLVSTVSAEPRKHHST